MNRYEFMTELQRQLTGKISIEKLQEITAYYHDYIDGELVKGKQEDEVLESLGDPRLLAKSIVETEGKEDLRSGDRIAYNGEEYADKDTKWDFSGNLNRILFWFVLILLLCLLLSAIYGLVGIFFRYVLPVLIPVLLVCWAIRLFKK